MEYAGNGQVLFIILWVSFWVVGVAFLSYRVYQNTRLLFESPSFKTLGPALFMRLFALPFWGGEFFGLWILYGVTDVYLVFLVTSVVMISWLFYYLLKAPTRLGRKVMDEIEGFRLYLEVAEREELQRLIEKEGVAGLFEKYLPYAIALDVERKWSEKFSPLLPGIQELPPLPHLFLPPLLLQE